MFGLLIFYESSVAHKVYPVKNECSQYSADYTVEKKIIKRLKLAGVELKVIQLIDCSI